MSDKRISSVVVPARERIDGRIIAVAFFLAVLVSEVALIRFVGPIGAPAVDPETLVGT